VTRAHPVRFLFVVAVQFVLVLVEIFNREAVISFLVTFFASPVVGARTDRTAEPLACPRGVVHPESRLDSREIPRGHPERSEPSGDRHRGPIPKSY